MGDRPGEGEGQRVRRSRPRPWRALVAFVGGAAVAAGVAVAWVPFRTSNSNVEVALALVAVMTAAGASRRRAAVIGAAVAAAGAFTFFDTLPYERFVIARQPDVATAVLLVVVGLGTGELALRVARNRRSELLAVAQLDRVRDAAALVADGAELVVLIGAVAAELVTVAGVEDSWFSADPLAAGTPIVGRSGELDPPATGPGPVALPVWALGQVVGHFLLRAGGDAPLRAERLRVAMTLADQVGAALAAQTPLGAQIAPDAQISPDAGDRGAAGLAPAPRLRVVRP